jgi:ParB/RepB/Spo0J family partition protein
MPTCNVRQQLATEEVDALAQSIKLLGQLTPVSVRPAEDGGYVLIAGHKRHAALTSLGETHVRAEIRVDDSHEESERAAENIVRSALNPYGPGAIESDATFGVSGGSGGACVQAVGSSSGWCECAR